MKKVFGAILWLMFVAITAEIGKDLARKAMEPNVEEQLQQISTQLNAKLPMQIDNVTKLENTVVGPGKKFTYVYHVNPEISMQQVMNSRANIVNGVCNGKLSVWLKKGVQIVYSYNNVYNQFNEIVVNYNDCF